MSKDSAKQFYIKFYPGDWLADSELRLCGPAAQGIWINLICIMVKDGDPYGHLALKGQPLTIDTLARLLPFSAAEIKAGIEELKAAGVARENTDGVLYSDRLVRDRVQYEAGREAAKKRWEGGKSSKVKAKPVPKSVHEDFDIWIGAYPRGENKAKAREKWLSLHKAGELPDLETLLLKLEEQKASESWREGYVPHPTTYLNGKRWEDQVDKPKPEPKYRDADEWAKEQRRG